MVLGDLQPVGVGTSRDSSMTLAGLGGGPSSSGWGWEAGHTWVDGGVLSPAWLSVLGSSSLKGPTEKFLQQSLLSYDTTLDGAEKAGEQRLPKKGDPENLLSHWNSLSF